MDHRNYTTSTALKDLELKQNSTVMSPWCKMEYPLSDCMLIVNGDSAYHTNSIGLVSNSRVLHDAIKLQLTRFSESTGRLYNRIRCEVSYFNSHAVADLLEFIVKLSLNEQLSNDDLLDLLNTSRLKMRLMVAKDFVVPRLIDGIIGSALQNLNLTNCCEIMAIAGDPQCACNLLELVAKEYIMYHFQDVAKTQEFVRFVGYQQLMECLKSDCLNAPYEIELFDIICNWVLGDLSTRLPHFPLLLNGIRASQLSTAERNYIATREFFGKTQLRSNAIVVDWFNELRPMSAPSDHPRLPHQAIFQIGGVKRTLPKPLLTMSAAVEVYDPLANTWTVHDKFSPALDARIVFSACVEFEDVVYLIGGVSELKDSERQDEHKQLAICARVQAYDLRKGVWRDRAPMHIARYALCGCQCVGKIYAIGGHTKDCATGAVEVYNSENNLWTVGPTMISRRTEAGAASLHGLIFVCGGRMERIYHSSMEQYNPHTHQWTLLAPMPRAGRAGLSLCPFKNFLFAIGGRHVANIYRSVYRYNLDMNTWQEVASLSTARCMLKSCVVYDKMYAIGGRTVQVDRPIVGYYSVERFNTEGEWESTPSSSDSTDNCACTISNCDLIQPLINRERNQRPR